MAQEISKDMYFSFKKILKQIPKKEIDEEVDMSMLEKDIISFLYKFFDTNYFNYKSKRDLPHLDVCNISIQFEDTEDMAQAMYSESARTIFINRGDIAEIAHGKRKLGDLINSLGHEYRHFLQHRAKEEDMQSDFGKEMTKQMQIGLQGDYNSIFENDMLLDEGLDAIKNFCDKKSMKESKFAQFVSKTIEETGCYARTIDIGQDSSQLHEEDARLAGIVFCSGFYNRMIRQAVKIGDSRFEKVLEKQKKIDVQDSVEYTEDLTKSVDTFKNYIDILKEEDSLFFIQLACEAYSKQDDDLIYFLNKTINDKCMLSTPEQLQDLVAEVLFNWDSENEQLLKYEEYAKQSELVEEEKTQIENLRKREEAQRKLFASVLESDAFANKDLVFYPKEKEIINNMATYDMKRFKKIKVLKRQNFFDGISK